MTTQFDRRWRVQVDDVVIEELRCSFTVERNLKAEPNKLDLSIFNLKKETRERLCKRDVKVEIAAGYKDAVGTIFVGTARRVYPVTDGPNVVLRVQGGDGEKALGSARFSQSFGPNTKIADVLDKMAGSLGVKADAAKERIRKGDYRGGLKEFVNGFNFSGALRSEFDRQMHNAGLTWSVQNGELQILAENETTQQEALRFAADTGLVGSPELADKGIVKFRVLMQAALSPGRKVVLSSKTINGTIKLTKLAFKGDSHGAEWFVDCEGARL